MKKIIAVLCAVAFSMGVFSLFLAPLTNSQSPFYSNLIDKIATEIIITPKAVFAGCEHQVCIDNTDCTPISDFLGCDDNGNDPCSTYNCSTVE